MSLPLCCPYWSLDNLYPIVALEHYFDIKAHLLRQSQQQVLNGDDHLSQVDVNQWKLDAGQVLKVKTHLIGTPALGTYIEDGWVVAQSEPIVAVSALRMPGEHNQQNLLMAVAAARLAGIEKMRSPSYTNFPGVPHSLEHMHLGIDFINDSKPLGDAATGYFCH